MSKLLYATLKRGVVTNRFPEFVDDPPDGFRGKPVIDFQSCTVCGECADACPTHAIAIAEEKPDRKVVTIDYGSCIFCGECEAACPDSIHLDKEFMLAALMRTDLVTGARYAQARQKEFKFVEVLSNESAASAALGELGKIVREEIHRHFGRSLTIREVDSGSCNGCEVEINALNNPIYDLERFGIHFAASPRHADALLITGPVTRNMEIAVRQAYEATPAPKIVIAAGACAISGGIFGKSYASCGGVEHILPVNVYIPGCPPRPEALLHGLLTVMGKL